jgi:hypothetical protein
MRTPVIYFAGKISKRDWRHSMVSGLSLDNEAAILNPSLIIGQNELGPSGGQMTYDWAYGGPFFRSCDHCCFHGPASHGAGVQSDGGGESWSFMGGDDLMDRLSYRRAAIFKVNHARVLRADAVFAFIESTDCYGTLVELGIKAAQNPFRPPMIVIGLAPGLSLADRDELWMVLQTAQHIFHGTAEECWEQFRRDVGGQTLVGLSDGQLFPDLAAARSAVTGAPAPAPAPAPAQPKGKHHAPAR